MKIFKKSIIYQYLLSYVIILVIAIIPLILLMNVRFLGVLNNEILKNNMNNLNIIMNTTDTKVKKLEDLQIQFFLSGIKPFSVRTNITLTLQCITLLKALTNSNECLVDTLVYFASDEYIYTSNGSFTPDIFIKSRLMFKNYNSEQFISYLKKITMPEIIPADELLYLNDTGRRIMIFIYPLRFNSVIPDTIFMFMVDENYFTEIMGGNSGELSAKSLVLDEKSNVVVTNDREWMHPKYEMDKLLQNLNNGYYDIQDISSEKYLTSANVSSITGWKYITLTPYSEIMAQTSAIRNDFILTLVFIMLVASIAIYFIVQSNFRPFILLKDYANTFYTTQSQNLNEIETVKEAIQYLNQKNTTLLEYTNKASKEHILLNILRGKYSEAQFHELTAEFGLSFPFSSYAVLYILLNGDNLSTHQYSEFADDAANYIISPFIGYITQGYSPNTILAILNFNETEAQELPKYVWNMHTKLYNRLGVQITIGIGGTYGNIADIPLSLMESSYACDYRFIKGNNSVILAGEVMEYNDEIDSYPYREMEKLSTMIYQGDAESVECILDSLLDYIKTCNIPMFMARRLCYDIVGIITKAMSNLGVVKIAETDSISYASKLIEYETVDDLTLSVRNICGNICRFIKEDRLNNSSQLDIIKGFIHANYTDSSFSIQTVADNVSMSLTNLSQYFKRKTGQTIVDYVAQLRMEHAKELLLKQKYKLDDIAGMTGYQNTSSFIRRFKQYAGITPGQFAKENSGG